MTQYCVGNPARRLDTVSDLSTWHIWNNDVIPAHANRSITRPTPRSIRAKLGVHVKRVLRQYGYPPDKQEKATQTVLSQAELLCADWMGA